VKHWQWKAGLSAMAIVLAASPVLFGQTQTSHANRVAASAGLTVDDVIRLAKAGLSEDIILEQIHRKAKAFDLSTEQLIALKNANVSDRVVETMLDPSKAESPAPAPSPSARPAATAPEPVAVAPTVPPPAPPPIPPPASPVAQTAPAAEVGVYAAKQGQWVEVPPEIVYWKSGGALKTVATAGILKGDVNGHIPGAKSATTYSGPLELLIVTPEGVVLTEYQLIRLRPHNDSREFRTVTGGVLHSSSGAFRDMVPFEGKKVANRMYQVTFPGTVGPGEYGILPPGSANGSGKIYSFHITE